MLAWLERQCAQKDSPVGRALTQAIRAECKETTQEYIKRMSTPLSRKGLRGRPFWGGPVELAAWSSMRCREVWVWVPSQAGGYSRSSCWEPIDGSAPKRKPASVLFRGSHYDALGLVGDAAPVAADGASRLRALLKTACPA